MAFNTLDEFPANGRLFSFGQSGLANGSIVLDNGEVISAMSSGAYHAGLLCQSGKVYMMGSNAIGQLGLETDIDDLNEEIVLPTRLMFEDFNEDAVVQVSCGGFHTLFRTVSGRVYSCGDNYYGQLGLGYNATHTSPFLISRLETMAQVAAGGSHSVALAVSGQVYVWGSNGWGELGFGYRGAAVRLPTLLAVNTSPVASISCGSYHNAFVTVDGSLYVSGGNYSGQLGIEISEECSAPKLVKLTSPIKQAACGARHTAILTENGDVWAWGDNEFGQVGGPDLCTPSPHPLLGGQKIVQVACGDGHTILLSESGKIWACGQGKYNKLGFSDDTNRTMPTVVADMIYFKFSVISCGAHMTLAFSPMKNDEASIDPPSVVQEPEPVAEPNMLVEGAHTGSIMLKHIESALTCPKCKDYLEPPIFLCEFSHNVCRHCCTTTNECRLCAICNGSVTCIRNSALETLYATLDMPCKECGAVVSASRRTHHSFECPKKQVCCPVEENGKAGLCRWMGPRQRLLAHAKVSHREHLWVEPVHNFTQPVFDGTKRSEIISAFGQTFVFYHHYSVDKQALLLAFQCVYVEGQKFAFEFSVGGSNDIDRMVFRKEAQPESGVPSDVFSGENYIKIPKEMLDSFIEDKLLKHCTLAVIMFDSCMKDVTPPCAS